MVKSAEIAASIDQNVAGGNRLQWGGYMQTSGIQTDYDVVIVGAGLTGAAMALALRDSGLRLAIVDAQPLQTSSSIDSAAPDFDARVSAITPASRKLFESLSVWDAMQQQRVSPYTHMHVREADGTGSIDFCAADVHALALGYIVENRISVAAMHQQLADQADLTCLMPATVEALRSDEHHVEISLANHEPLTARLLIAADGAQSPVRKLAGFVTREWDYEHEAIVCSVKTEQPHDLCARQIFMNDGVLAFLPLRSADDDSNGHWCSIVWSVQPARAQALMGLSDDVFRDTLGYASEHWLGKITDSSRRFAFPLRQRHAQDYFKDRVVLIGDAAHSIHPLAGQGANLGLTDVSVLARELLKAQGAGRDPADPLVLARYQRQRKPHNLAMMLMMEGFKRLYADQPLPLRWLRNVGMKTVDNWPLLKHQLIREAMGTHLKID
jgi:2-octaprenylphenol hydroxylase